VFLIGVTMLPAMKAATAEALAGSPKVTSSEDVQEGHQRDKTEDAPRQFPASSQVRPVSGQVDPYEDYSERMQKTDQELKQLLHDLNVPRPRGPLRPLPSEITRPKSRQPLLPAVR
jgi:hypothetical protein